MDLHANAALSWSGRRELARMFRHQETSTEVRREHAIEVAVVGLDRDLDPRCR